MKNPLLPRERKEYRLAEKLRRLRSLRGLAQREVAQAAGIDESTVRNCKLWKDELRDRFSKRDRPAVYSDYDLMRPDSGQRWISERFAAILEDMRRIRSLSQEELAEKADLSLFTPRSYGQGKRMPRAKQMEALCEALGVTSMAPRHYFGNPNQAMHYLFAIAGAGDLTPESDDTAGLRLCTQGNYPEWTFVQLSNQVTELGDNPTQEQKAQFTNWLSKLDVESSEFEKAAKKADRLRANVLTKLPPRA